MNSSRQSVGWSRMLDFAMVGDGFERFEVDRTAVGSDGGPQSRQSEQVVGRRGYFTLQLDLPSTDEPRSSQSADRLAPAEDILDPLANSLTDRVALGSGSPPRATTGLSRPVIANDRSVSNRRVWYNAKAFHRVEELPVFVSRVRAQSPRPQTLTLACPIEHRSGLDAFGRPVGFVDVHIQTQGVSILHQQMQAVAEQGRFAVALTQQACLGIDETAVRGIGTFLATEVDRGIALVVIITPVTDLGISCIHRPQTLHRGERLDQTAIDAEVIAADQPVEDRLLHHPIKEVAHEAVVGEALTVHAEDFGRPDDVRGIHVQEPAEQQVVPDLLAELDFAADAVEGLQQQGLDQPLGRDAGPARLAVRGAEPPGHLLQNPVGPRLDRPQRMTRRDPIVNVEDMVNFTLRLDSTAHRSSSMTRFDALYGRIQSPVRTKSFLAAC